MTTADRHADDAPYREVVEGVDLRAVDEALDVGPGTDVAPADGSAIKI